MKVPNWFVVGCGLLALNLILVLGGTVSRHASAKAPLPQTAELTTDNPLKISDQEPPAAVASEVTAERATEDGGNVLAPANDLAPLNIHKMPSVPSIDGAPTGPSVLKIDDFKQVFNSSSGTKDLLAPLDEMLKETPDRIPEQLSHSFFEGMKLRLQTAEHLNQSSLGLVEEAAILYQRGDVEKAQELLGMATQLREMTAKLLVSHP